MRRLFVPFFAASAGFLVLKRLGFGPIGSIGLIAAIVLGGAVDVPLPNLFRGSPRLLLNVGGGLIPLGLAAFLMIRLPNADLRVITIVVAVVAAVSYLLARPEPGRGIVLPWIFPAMLAAAMAIVAGPDRAGAVAFVGAAAGTFLGADLLHLRSLGRIGALRVGLGGSGPADGILWSALLAAALAGGVW